jgi:hypothetical protein
MPTAMTNQELKQRCQQVIAEARVHMQDARSPKMQEKWRLIRETWENVLQKVRATELDP